MFSDKPLIKFERLLENNLGFAPKGIQSFLAAMPVWLKEKLFMRNLLQKEVLACSNGLNKSELPVFLFGEHHEPHGHQLFMPYPMNGPVFCVWMGSGSGRPLRLNVFPSPSQPRCGTFCFPTRSVCCIQPSP